MDSTMFSNISINMDRPTTLYSEGDHAVYWLGITDETAFRCNAYLIVDGDQAIIVDPGSRNHFEQVHSRVEQILPADQITGLIICHQDPDVAASMIDWLEVNPELILFTSPRTMVLLPHYGRSDFKSYDIEQEPSFTLPSGKQLEFITAPFLHSPAAFVTFDTATGFLFSGDIWAALTTEWTLVTEDFEQHALNMDLFHVDYMASNVAANGFVNKVAPLAIEAILPQHGSIIAGSNVSSALDYLRDLRCGTDIAYPELS